MADRERAHSGEKPRRVEGGIDRDYLRRRTEALANALARPGMPITWGTGKPRTDDAWVRDQERRAARRSK